MDFNELVQSRRSIRKFKKQNVSKEDIIKIIKAAQHAPSGGNCQPWHFFVIFDKNIQAEIKNKSCNQAFILSAPVFIIVCADIERSEKKYGERGRDLYCIQDTAAAVQNILLCAKDLGLGACWCGDFNENTLSAILQLKNNLRPIAIIPVGYPVSEPVSVNRRPIDEIITFIGDNTSAKDTEKEENLRIVEHCDMEKTTFDDVNLGNSKFSNINFYGVDISDANLTNGLIHDCNLSNFKIYNCNLAGMTINGKNVMELLRSQNGA